MAHVEILVDELNVSVGEVYVSETLQNKLVDAIKTCFGYLFSLTNCELVIRRVKTHTVFYGLNFYDSHVNISNPNFIYHFPNGTVFGLANVIDPLLSDPFYGGSGFIEVPARHTWLVVTELLECYAEIFYRNCLAYHGYDDIKDSVFIKNVRQLLAALKNRRLNLVKFFCFGLPETKFVFKREGKFGKFQRCESLLPEDFLVDLKHPHPHHAYCIFDLEFILNLFFMSAREIIFFIHHSNDFNLEQAVLTAQILGTTVDFWPHGHQTFRRNLQRTNIYKYQFGVWVEKKKTELLTSSELLSHLFDTQFDCDDTKNMFLDLYSDMPYFYHPYLQGEMFYDNLQRRHPRLGYPEERYPLCSGRMLTKFGFVEILNMNEEPNIEKVVGGGSLDFYRLFYPVSTQMAYQYVRDAYLDPDHIQYHVMFTDFGVAQRVAKLGNGKSYAILTFCVKKSEFFEGDTTWYSKDDVERLIKTQFDYSFPKCIYNSDFRHKPIEWQPVCVDQWRPVCLKGDEHEFLDVEKCGMQLTIHKHADRNEKTREYYENIARPDREEGFIVAASILFY